MNGDEPAILTDHLPQRQIELSPPLNISSIAKGANHENAGTLFDACALIGKDRYRDSEERCNGAFAEERLVPFVLRMGHNSDTGREQFRAGRRNDKRTAAFDPEADRVKRSSKRPIFDLSLCDRSLKIYIPESWRFGGIGVSLRE